MGSVTAWVCVSNSGNILVSTVADKRTTAIKRLVGHEDGWQKAWRWLRLNHGVTCQRVALLRVGEG